MKKAEHILSQAVKTVVTILLLALTVLVTYTVILRYIFNGGVPAAEELVRYLMPRIPLKAGDVIFTGTPSGVMLGYPADQKRWLRAGDTVEVTIEGIGTLKNSFQ